ncbi:hypothetical protein NDU88_000569, partial [Pleurodeles waltl]
VDNKNFKSNTWKILERLTSAGNMNILPAAMLENQPLKRITIPKIRRPAKEAHMELCLTDRREYSDINSAINKSRLDLNCDLQSSWQFGDIKLVYNYELEQKFSTKR